MGGEPPSGADADGGVEPGRFLRSLRGARVDGGEPRAPFFAVCLLLVVVWLVQGAVTVMVGGHFSAFLNDKYQLEINTTTTIITFLMVALLQNSQTREDQATQHKLNAIADGLADLMGHVSERARDDALRRDIAELRAAVGLEERESTSGNRAGEKVDDAP
jgi:Low affinity iron permease